jgi:methionyl-tRNA formyltransferase
LVEFLESFGDEVVQTMEPADFAADWIVAYGYRRRIDKEILNGFPRRAINLHISYLPWNRGADPNLWSFLEDTPKGVTIHYLDGNIDTGDVIAQRTLNYSESDTLRTTYRRLSEMIESLFREMWPVIREGKVNSLPQLTYHRSGDKDRYMHLLPAGWDTPIKNILGKGR